MRQRRGKVLFVTIRTASALAIAVFLVSSMSLAQGTDETLVDLILDAQSANNVPIEKIKYKLRADGFSAYRDEPASIVSTCVNVVRDANAVWVSKEHFPAVISPKARIWDRSLELTG